MVHKDNIIIKTINGLNRSRAPNIIINEIKRTTTLKR